MVFNGTTVPLSLPSAVSGASFGGDSASLPTGFHQPPALCRAPRDVLGPSIASLPSSLQRQLYHNTASQVIPPAVRGNHFPAAAAPPSKRAPGAPLPTPPPAGPGTTGSSLWSAPRDLDLLSSRPFRGSTCGPGDPGSTPGGRSRRAASPAAPGRPSPGTRRGPLPPGQQPRSAAP